MDEESAKAVLHQALQHARDALVWKLDGLGEYDVRRPLTVTGTNLLGLVKHAATWEARYLGDVFGRPFPEPLERWEDSDGSDLWVTADESREQVVDLFRRARAHADATVDELALDAEGQVPWWSRPDVTLFAVLVHLLGETTRHAGHADVVREQLDGRTGVSASWHVPIDTAAREAHRARIERAARAATGGQV